MKDFDILCVQEHWLATFEAEEILNSSSHCPAIKCYDEGNTIVPSY